jgi:hypothetical protein
MSHTAETVAAWMMAQIHKHGELHQDEAASEIYDNFGEEFVPDNQAGNPSIRKDVLKAFRLLSGDGVVWIREDRLWRRREIGDDRRRQQS